MSLRINVNTAALNAHRQLQSTDKALSVSIERLSSGYRINTAADDPAGLAISENFRAKISGTAQAIANSTDAVNMLKTAEGSLAEVHTLLRQMRDRALHAANTGATDDTAIANDQTQITESISALNRIATNTKFGDKALLDGTASGLTFQIGANSGQTMTLDIDAVTASVLGISSIDVTAAGGAASAITALDTAISSVSTMRAELGAKQMSLESNITALSIAKENIQASESAVRDTDMAAEMVQFTRNQILLQAGTAMLTQANQAPQALLALLR